MAGRRFFRFWAQAPLLLLFCMSRITNALFRAGFVATALSEGVLALLAKGPASLEQIQQRLGIVGDSDGLKAWLEMGVALKELRKTPDGYAIAGFLSRRLARPANDAWAAFLRIRVEVFHRYITQTPSMLRQKRKFLPSGTHARLYARSSRTLEPFLLALTDRIIPEKGIFSLLEAGCGTGGYIKRACDRNPLVTAVGLELEPSVVELARHNLHAWQLGHRASVQQASVRQYQNDHHFDLVTGHNLICCFPVGERVDLLRQLGCFLRPGGRVVLTSLCQGRTPSQTSMNLWSTMTDGYGALPRADTLCDQFRAAGFVRVRCEQIIPGLFLFDAWLE